MKDDNNSETKDFGSEAVGSEFNVIYKCKNCERTLSFYDVVNFYGIPACPVCLNSGAPFEIEQQSRDFDLADNSSKPRLQAQTSVL